MSDSALRTLRYGASMAWMAGSSWRIAVAIAAATATSSLVAAQPPAGQPPLLHEPIPDFRSDAASSAIGGKSGRNPTAISAGAKVLPKPPLDPPRSSQRMPVLGTGDFSADRQTSMTPDNRTGSDQTLHYISVFNPDVLPWKRMSAFDQVADNFALYVRRSALTELVVGGASSSRTRDSFWGDMMVQLRPGLDVALPSVAPDMRILSYETSPAVRLVFSKDGADNFYVRSDESNASGTFHLVFYADADAGYFAPQLPAGNYRVRDVADRAPPDLKPALPPAVMREASTTLRNLGLHPDVDFAMAFNALVDWGRGFSPGEITKPSGNLYRDLSDHQAGVCRHRSYAFMVTATALGIPTRLVENEAHAFVEVWFPQRGWQRIDLGGAALQLEVAGANNKQLHRPRADDPFSKPPQYRHTYTQLEGNIAGLTDQQRAARAKPIDDPPASNRSRSATANTGSNQRAQLPTTAPDPQKLTPTLAVTRASASAYRGDRMHVEGIIRIGSRPLANHFIYVYLAPAGRHGAHSTQLGSLRSNLDGTFNGELPVPAQVDLSTYEVYVSSPEDPTYNAALSQ